MRRLSTIGVCLVTMLGAGLLSGTPAGATERDVTAPTTPGNLRVVGVERGNAVLAWDASRDNSGRIYHYWVLVDGFQRLRPTATTMTINKLVDLYRIERGRHMITVQAVDWQLNRSGSSQAVEVNVVM